MHSEITVAFIILKDKGDIKMNIFSVVIECAGIGDWLDNVVQI